MSDQTSDRPNRAGSVDESHHVRNAQSRAARSFAPTSAGLNRSTVLIVHAPDAQSEVVARAVRRVGCAVEIVWPVPVIPPLGFDFALVALDEDVLLAAPWLSGAPPLPIVAVIDGEKGLRTEVLRLSNVQAVLVKPCQPAAVLLNLALARQVFGYERRLQNKIIKLEETLHASRQIEQAKLILMQQRKLRANEAYDYLRRQAMSKHMSVAAISAALVDAYGLID